MMRDLTRRFISLAKHFEKKKEDRNVPDIYQSLLLAGKKYAPQEPLSIIKMLVGLAINGVTYASLKNYFEVKGLKKEFDWAKKQEEILNEILKLTRKKIEKIKPSPFFWWTLAEIIMKKNKDAFYFMEAPVVREMLAKWPDVNLP